MLPRSLFSASSLKYGQSSEGHSDTELHSSNMPYARRPTTHDDPPQIRRPGTSAKSPMTIDSENEQYISGDSVSLVGSSDDDDDDHTSIPSNLQGLMHHLSRLQAKQTLYIEKTQEISRQMQDTSAKIAELTGMSLYHPPGSSSSSSSNKYLRTDARPLKHKMTVSQQQQQEQESRALPTPSAPSSSSTTTTANQASPWKRPQLAKRTGGSQPLPAPKAPRNDYYQQERQVQHRRSSRDMTQPKTSTVPSARHGRIIKSESLSPSPETSSPSAEEQGGIKLRSRDTCDLYLHRNQDVNSGAFGKKPRSLIYNIADGQGELKDLMVTTSLKGNASKRKLIKTIGQESIYPDSWIEEICWTTKKTLALCNVRASTPTEKENATVSLLHVDSVSNTDVKYRLQHLEESPHTKPIVTIAPVDLGATGSAGVERATFVTGGSDKAVYFWDIIRDSPDEDFALSDVSKLNINHTNYIQTFCYDPTHRKLFTGGADCKMFTYDMLSQRVSTEMKISCRINHILGNAADPNLYMLLTANTSNQFNMYDQRMPGMRGIVLDFGYKVQENLSRYIRPDWHQNGYMVACGSQTESKVHFWDIRYSGVDRGPCFSFNIPNTSQSRILASLFVPNQNTLVTTSSTRNLGWIDYSIQHDSRIHTL
ncbi:hypothetical protein RO3G_03171 [Lichtheimia corymbifera JMRC:FSU:9682]|uniref:Uncharacterized protein n=1 Tax=Lichtheimia corymbifera JMRC:FSU:9682 TaxID=1263082 RepID=A0A068RXP9_9FUNG|nr:hypothetical protein RO3G_03171 [Lichtheimia corymbifera JMRC:FSU:9682]